MKERIVITEELEIKSLKEIEKEYDSLFMSFPEYEVEKVPETWEELEELCKDIKGVKVFGGCISIGEDSHETYFLKDGTIGKENGADVWWNTDIAQNRTPQQMWQIIKNLIGENNDTTKET